MSEFTANYLMPFVLLLEEMAPYLLLGFLIAGILHAFVPRTFYSHYLGKNNTSSVLMSLLIGIPLPLCSCGVIPTAVGMRKEGASRGATSAFLISTPQTGVDSILATYSVLGLPLAIMRPIIALITGLFGGIATNLLVKEDDAEVAAVDNNKKKEVAKKSFVEKCRIALDYGFNDMLMDIGQWLVIGLILAGLITIFVPDNFFVSYQGNYLLNMLIVLLIACPMYVCATGSIPVAAALMLKGLSPGAALVFLMAGPATNMASMMVLGKTLGRKSLLVYLGSILVGAIGFGILVDAFLPAEWFDMSNMSAFHASCCHDEEVALPWWQHALTILLVILLIRGLFMRIHGHHCHCHEHSEESTNTTNNMKTFKVEGMMCNHCRAHVQQAIEGVAGVTSVNVDLAAGTATVEGTAADETIIEAVTKCGYACHS